ncbi:tetratricopeptide repeat-containing glycosyltransferase [Sporosalibacterium faouarense]|uniref:tetratricopeptide repeat-containing glycosyltransferase n=1 Tax=Sporosalibacterium faouarense TaxID=516123 RepID=UPI00141C5EB0|nr:glycosyltransferase [Sporosalibacterium faouarense]MTI47166.1 glycosyltransferase [Bacillota bacterium]
MSKYKICVYAISKNEEQFVDRWMDSVSEADMVVVLDTGSEDNTVEKLRQKGAIVYEKIISPWRFDKARNIALSHVPEDVDICVCNDLDEVFESGWRQKLESAWSSKYTRARYLFTSSYNSDKTPKKQYPMEKIHCRHNFHWIHPVHEILEYSGTKDDKTVWVNGLVLNHYPDKTKSRSQYLPLLELSAKENPQDDRTIFWLGREYMYYEMYDQCIEVLKKYLTLSTATWNEERSASMRFISQCYESKGNLRKAKAWLFRAIAECPNVREPYLYMAKLGYKERNWSMVYAMIKKGLSITKKSGSYLVEEACWDFALYDYGAIGAYRLGLYDESLNYAKKAYELNPLNQRLKSNLELIEKDSMKSQKMGCCHE